ncbi:MAG: ribonuclease P protein component [Tissierellia bacterium]|nr:ribonuclease P protein component [Tissierellia bacterium]
MDKRYRLRSNQDFKKVYRNGKYYWNRNLVLYLSKNDLGHTRVGITVTKKIGKSVVRNKVKRRIREIIRKNFHNIKEEYDIILVPKKNVVDIDFKTLESAVIHILKISGILKNTGENNG